MKEKKIFILLGNPDADSFTGKLVDKYEKGAREAGHKVKRFNIGEMDFDPILHKGYKEIQELEPDLVEAQKAIKWADHVVIAYPNWWNTMPAILKGFFDRAWLPGFAFNFDKKTKKVIQHLKGKSARVIVVIGSHTAFRTWLNVGDFTNEVEHGILEFAGFYPVRVKCFGPAERCNEEEREEWLEQARELGKKGI